MSEFRTTDASFSTINGTLVPTSETLRLFNVTRDLKGKILTSVSIQPTMSLKHNRIVIDHTVYSNDVLVRSGTKVTGEGFYDATTQPQPAIITLSPMGSNRAYTIFPFTYINNPSYTVTALDALIPVDYYKYNDKNYYFDPDGILYLIDDINGRIQPQTDPISITPIALSIPNGSFIGQQLTIAIISTYSNTTLYTNFPSHGSLLPVLWNGSDWKRINMT